MENKSIILELSCELIDRIDRQNKIGDRSKFISELLENQLKQDVNNGMDASTELTTSMGKPKNLINLAQGEIDIINNKGASIGKFNLDTVEGFQDLADKIQEISKDPIVRMRARGWL